MQINPLWWLHARIGGSPRSHWLLVVAYLAIVFVFASITARFVEAPPNTPPDYGPYYTAWLGVVSGAQAVFLLLLIPSAIKKAVQRDYLNGMAESHRLTPMSNRTIVLGYLLGPAIPSLMLYAPGLLIGVYFAAKAAGSMAIGASLGARAFVGGWLISQGLLLILAFMVSAVSLLAAIAARESKFNIFGLLIVIGFMGGWGAVLAVPGFALLTGFMSGSVMWTTIVGRGAAIGNNTALLTACALQIAVGVTMLTAAGRRFRAPDRPVFTLPVSLVLIGLWGLALVLGMVHAAASSTPLSAQFADLNAARLAFSLMSFMAVSLFVLHAAAVARLALDRRRLFTREPLAARARLLAAMPTAVTLLGMLVLALMVAAVPAGSRSLELQRTLNQPMLWAAVGIALLLSSATDAFAFYWAAANRARTWLVLLVTWGLLKIAPVLLDGMLLTLADNLYEREWTWHRYLTSVSPIGTILLTVRPCWEIGLGLLVQLALMLVAAAMTWRARRQLPQRITTYAGSTGLAAQPAAPPPAAPPPGTAAAPVQARAADPGAVDPGAVDPRAIDPQ